ncbi:MAG TPA: pyruvate dehydrogenase complex dihydrolipoamide acetyltransferase [Gemmatimonadaceae bacterium]|nr:pyruvate dehydrogenase complex dihydrolipoamide acetyltransferase [Gemmatimonadaceae bacterium]
MATKVVMEALSPTMEEGRLVKWLKSEGDQVKSGETLAEVETDKAVMELVARGDGVLRTRLAAEGDTTPVGQLIAVIAAPDENIDELIASAGGAKAEPRKEEAKAEPKEEEAKPEAPQERSAAPREKDSAAEEAPEPKERQATPAPASPRGDGERTRSSPLARRLASEQGLDLGAVQGSGPGGRIVKRDIEAAIQAGGAKAAAPAAAAAPAQRVSRDEEEYADVPLSQMRKTIARRLAESIGPVPTFYLTAEFDLERAAEMRTAMAALGDEYKVSFNDIIMKATATALAMHPEVNAHWLGDRIRHFNRVHLGMAVAIDEGLITPVIFDADVKRMSEISAEAKALAKRARDRKLKPEEYMGATFSVSNLGMFGIEHFTAIINPPEAGILAVGGVEERPVIVEGELVMRKRMKVTMSCDHRVIDGATGAKFLQTLRRMIENPLFLVY